MTTTSKWRRYVWPDWSQRKTTLRRQTWAALIAIYLAILFAYFWPTRLRGTEMTQVLPAWAAFMVRTFIYHWSLLGLLIAAVALVNRNRRMALAAMPLALGVLPLCWSFVPHAAPGITGPPLRVMSVNLLMINRDTEGIIAEVLAADPDIVFLQEYTDHWHRAMQSAFAKRYPHYAGQTAEDSFGTAIYSKRAFTGHVELHMPLGTWGMEQMRTTVEHAGRTVTIMNIHTLPPKSLEYMTEHRLMVADLADTLRKIDGPYILAGDFNFIAATPHAAVIQQTGALDAHELAGRGPGFTWPVNSFLRYLPVPGLRLDHIYLGGGLVATACTTGFGRGSDHRPLLATLGFAADSAP